MGDDIVMLKAAIAKATKKNVSVKSAQKVRRLYHANQGAIISWFGNVSCISHPLPPHFFFLCRSLSTSRGFCEPKRRRRISRLPR